MTTKLQDNVTEYQTAHLRHIHNIIHDINSLTAELTYVCASFTAATYTNEAARLVSNLRDRCDTASELLAVLQVLREIQKP